MAYEATKRVVTPGLVSGHVKFKPIGGREGKRKGKGQTRPVALRRCLIPTPVIIMMSYLSLSLAGFRTFPRLSSNKLDDYDLRKIVTTCNYALFNHIRSLHFKQI